MSPWALILFGVEQRHPIAELTFCGPESSGHEHPCALLLKPLWELRKPWAPLSFGQDYLPYQSYYRLSRSDKLLFKTSVPTKGWRDLLVGCLLWGRGCYESPLTWGDCVRAAGGSQDFPKRSRSRSRILYCGEIKLKCSLHEK